MYWLIGRNLNYYRPQELVKKLEKNVTRLVEESAQAAGLGDLQTVSVSMKALRTWEIHMLVYNNYVTCMLCVFHRVYMYYVYNLLL